MSVVFDTGSVAPRERLEFWLEIASKAFFPCAVRQLGGAAFRGQINQYVLGPLTITRVAGDSSQLTRSSANIATYDPESVHLSMQLSGRTTFRQEERSVAARPGEMVMYDPAKPLNVVSSEPFELIDLSTSKSLLGGRATRRQHTAVAVDGTVARNLVGPFLAALAEGLVAGTVSEGDDELGEGALDLMRALCVTSRCAGDDVRRHSSDTLLAAIKAYIEAHLGDADLGLTEIARAHFISTRYLQKLFHGEGLTVSDWVRQRRLAACRRDLGSAEYADETILAIAMRSGFRSPSHFSRTFRDRYGCSPSDVRDAALGSV